MIKAILLTHILLLALPFLGHTGLKTPLSICESDSEDDFRYTCPAKNVMNFWCAHRGICDKMLADEPLTAADFAELKHSTNYLARSYKEDDVNFMKELRQSIKHVRANREACEKELGGDHLGPAHPTRNFIGGMNMLRKLDKLLPESFKSKRRKHKRKKKPKVISTAAAAAYPKPRKKRSTRPATAAMDITAQNSLTTQQSPKTDKTLLAD